MGNWWAGEEKIEVDSSYNHIEKKLEMRKNKTKKIGLIKKGTKVGFSPPSISLSQCMPFKIKKIVPLCKILSDFIPIFKSVLSTWADFYDDKESP